MFKSERGDSAGVRFDSVGSSDKAAVSDKESTSQRKEELYKYIQKCKPVSVETLTSTWSALILYSESYAIVTCLYNMISLKTGWSAAAWFESVP